MAVLSEVRGGKLMRAFGMGLAMQALLSGANFAVGLILIRRTSDLQYGYYILATNALLLLTSLQTSFIQPFIVASITRFDAAKRREVVGGLIRANRHWVPIVCALAIAATGVLRLSGELDAEQTLLVVISVVAGGAALGREFFRVTLFAYRHPPEVLRGDIAYVAILLAAAYGATFLANTALAAVAGLGVAALVASAILRRGLRRFEPWNERSTEAVLGKIAAAGAWAITGAGIHWLLIQGYSYLVAGVLNVADVAALAATRLTLVPVFVLSGGVSMLLFPITSRWVEDKGAPTAARRLSLLVLALGALALLYMIVMWTLRDWLFDTLLKKHFAQRDTLILLWSAVFLVTLCRDQLATLPAARARFRDMTLTTGFSAVIWLLSSYVAMMHFGPAGAVLGILIGESVNIGGIIALIVKEVRLPRVVAAA